MGFMLLLLSSLFTLFALHHNRHNKTMEVVKMRLRFDHCVQIVLMELSQRR